MSSPQLSTRVEIIDALRGFALMGLFLIHALEYFDLYWLRPEPGPVHNLMFFLFAGKAYAIFAMMFGLSFFIIMDRQAKRGVNFTGRFIWRLTILLAIGCLHGLLYLGDILQVLALLGLLLTFINRFSNRIILLLSILCTLQLPLIYQILSTLSANQGADAQPVHWALYGKAFQVFAQGSLWEAIRFNIWDGRLAMWSFMLESGRALQMAGMFMWGLLLGRIGFFINWNAYRKIIWPALGLALIASVTFYYLKDYAANLPADFFQSKTMAKWSLNQLLDNYLSIALMIVGVLLFVVLYQSFTFCRNLLNLLVPYGRMSLTHYLSQSIICVPLFYGFGLGLYDSIGQVRALLLGIILFILQVVIAHYWMRRYHYGPLEWAWRSATYMTTKVPFRRRP